LGREKRPKQEEDRECPECKRGNAKPRHLHIMSGKGTSAGRACRPLPDDSFTLLAVVSRGQGTRRRIVSCGKRAFCCLCEVSLRRRALESTCGVGIAQANIHGKRYL
jgi:hypothetical protein